MNNIKYYPQDDNREFGTIGLKFPINGDGLNGKGFFNTSRTTEEQAITNYKNLLLTMEGERYMHPNYGIGIQTFLFEQNSGVIRTEMEFRIRTQCAYWLPYIVNHKIEIRDRANIPGMNVDPENAIQIVIHFSVTEQGANKQMTIFQRSGVITINVED